MVWKNYPAEPLFATANVVFKEVLLRQDFINDNEDQNIRQAMEEFEEDQLCGQALDEQQQSKQQSEDEWISYEDEWMMQTDGANDLCGQASYEDRKRHFEWAMYKFTEKQGVNTSNTSNLKN